MDGEAGRIHGLTQFRGTRARIVRRRFCSLLQDRRSNRRSFDFYTPSLSLSLSISMCTLVDACVARLPRESSRITAHVFQRGTRTGFNGGKRSSLSFLRFHRNGPRPN